MISKFLESLSLEQNVAIARNLSPRKLELDGIRGIAIIMVVLFHYIVQRLITTPGSLVAYSVKYASNFWVGVDIFFVLSGFLVGGILLDKRKSPNYLNVFYIRRFCRIIPLYILFLALFCFAVFMHEVTPRTSMRWLLDEPFPFWSYVLYIQNIFMAYAGSLGPSFANITWSLAVEEQFYLFLPLLISKCVPNKLPKILLVLILMAPLLRWLIYILFPAEGKIAGYVLLPMRWDSLLMGTITAWAIRNQSAQSWFSTRWYKLRLGFLVGVIGIGIMPLIGCYKATMSMILVGHLWIAITIGLLLLLLDNGQLSEVTSFLSSPLLRFFGKLSYSIYLFHVAILGVLFSLILKKEPNLNSILDWVIMIGAFLSTILFAQITWSFLEHWMITFGHRFNYHSLDPAGSRMDVTPVLVK